MKRELQKMELTNGFSGVKLGGAIYLQIQRVASFDWLEHTISQRHINILV